jgi:hypothetical protein
MCQGDVSMCYGFASPAPLGPNFPVQDDRAYFYDFIQHCVHSYCRVLPYRQVHACGSCMLVLHIILVTMLKRV